MARCENVSRPDCPNTATNAVPAFMGSVWMCARCSVETDIPTDSKPEIRVRDYVRIVDLDVYGTVRRITKSGECLVSYFSGGEFCLVFRKPDTLELI